MGRPLPRRFYAGSVTAVARGLLGRILVHDSPQGRLAGRIVEVEAYRGADDPASHAYRGLTPRNAVMYGAPGHAYVYFTYGMHHCLNLVTGAEGTANAVLVRALEPLVGLAPMRENRGVTLLARLARGPGCVTRALGLSLQHNGVDMTRRPLWVSEVGPDRQGLKIEAGPRIGIRVGLDRKWRFFLAGHPCVSGPRRRRVSR